jgi:pyrroline-5-carboxylate reductase
MAAAMVRGLAGDVELMLFTDSGSGRAVELAAEVGGEAVATNAELAERADVVVLAVKPGKLAEAAAELTEAKVVVSLLGATSLQKVRGAFPAAEVVRVMPNVAVEVRRGVLCVAGEPDAELRAMLERLGHVVELEDSEFDAATAVMGCAPAYLALAVEAIADAGAADGLDEELARRAVASPGGSTEAGLEALDRLGARRAFEAAVEASLGRMRG